MGRLRSSGPWSIIAIASLLAFTACGGGSKAGPPLFPGKIGLIPSSTTSLNLGSTLSFVASVQTASGTNLNTAVTYSSSDTSVLNLSPNGVACAGHWDAAFTACTPGASGVALVTANALGGTSVPTYVFVHPQIDNITVNGVLLDGVPVQEPCLSQSQSMTLEAHAFSQGSDITASVGPFTWSASNPTVAALTPFNNSTYKFPTNQVTAQAVTPGITYIYATASGTTSTSFQQPQLTNSQGSASPVLDFFATCPIQNIALEMGAAGSGQTSIAVAKGGAAQTVIATVMDVMGNTSLTNTNGGVVLSKVPLTWSSSAPGAISTAAGCTQSCGLTLTGAGSATVTASCSPPTCNVGFPVVPASLSNSTLVNNCTTYFQATYPNFGGCQLLIPTPVYSSSNFIIPPDQQISISPMAAISAVVSGSASAASVFAGSTGCAHVSPTQCSSSVYYLSTTKAVSGNENPTPVPGNSFLFDPTGSRVYMGSDFGAEIISPSSFGSNSSAFSGLGTVTGKVLAVSANGNSATFSDTIHTPNQVYVTSSTGAPAALPISNGASAAYSPDGLKTFIAGGSSLSSLYVYSSLQALQGPIALAGPANAITFSPNGAFAFVAESIGVTGNIAAFATCNNSQVATSVALPANPILMKILPNVHIDGRDSYGYTIPDGIHLLVLDSTGFNIVTSVISPPAVGSLCPQTLTFLSNDPARVAQRVELGQTINQPSTSANFFPSPDGEQLYIVNPGNSSILIYSFVAGAVTGGIELQGSATPVSSGITADASTIVVAGTDGLLHNVSTLTGGADLSQVSFPNIPNFLNAFCSFTPSTGPCTLDTVLVKP